MTSLSPRELEVLQNTEFLRTKAQAFNKIVNLLELVEQDLEQLIQASTFRFPEGTLDLPGKISRGEKYRGLPYLVLDLPRKFQADSTFAFRTIFLWGDSFSNTFQLAGDDLDHYRRVLKTGIWNLKDLGFWVCHNQSEWEHHFGPDNYVQLENLNTDHWQQIIEHQPFLKLARRIEISQWKELSSFSTSTFDLVLKCIEH